MLPITNDAVILGFLIAILAFVFVTNASTHIFWRRFYTFVPSLLLCYLLPSLLTMTELVDAKKSNLYFMASRYLLPASLVYLTISVDLKEILRLGPKALIMFFTGTAGVLLGGPLTLWFYHTVAPGWITSEGSQATWRGLSTVAGSWIGGGANQAAMKEVFEVGTDFFSAFVTVDIIIASLWMAVLLILANKATKFDSLFRADTSAIQEVKEKIEKYQKEVMRIPKTHDTFTLLAFGFGATAIAHFAADGIVPIIETHAPELKKYSLTSSFFWIVITATTIGLVLSFTPARKLEGVGASRFGSVFLYILIATIGLKVNLMSIFEHPQLFVIGLTWILFHAALMLIVAYLIRAPLFLMAVGSQANVGGAASAPIVASVFHPALAPVGVLLAVFGYVLGTYCAWLCGLLMKFVSE